MVKLSLGYPSYEDEVAVIRAGDKAKAEIRPVTGSAQVRALIDDCKRVYVSPLVSGYIVQIVSATRTHADIRLGASPRGSIALHALSKAFALAQGRNYVKPDDVKVLAPYVLAHRLILTQRAKTAGTDPFRLVETIVSQVVVPVEPKQ